MRDDNLPTAILVDSDLPETELTDTADLYREYVQAPIETAQQAEVSAPMSVALPPAQVKVQQAAKTSLSVDFGGEAYELRCTEQAVKDFVLAAYLFGGYPAVVRARQALDQAIRKLETQYDSEDRIHEFAADRAASHAESSDYQRNVESARTALVNAKVAAQRAQAAEPYYSTYFRQSWQALAELEEHWLSQYEIEADRVLTARAIAAYQMARDEWDKYQPYAKSDPSRTPVAFGKAEINEDYRLTLDVDRATAEAKAKDLLEQALHLHELAKDVAYSKAHERRDSINDRLKRWNEERTKIAAQDPVLLHVYPQVWLRDTYPGTLQDMMAKALLESRDEALRMFNEQMLVMGSALRIDPLEKPTGFAWPQMNPEAFADLYSNLPERSRKGLEKYGLTLSASVVLARRLRQRKVALNSPWMHLPVRLEIFENGKEGLSMAAYADPAAFEYAALKHLWDALEQVREEEQAAKTRRTVLLAVAGAGLAPFTKGGSLVAAAWVQAALSASEIAQAVTDFKQQTRLATMLAPVESLLWTRPAAGDLLQVITARSFDVITTLIPANKLPFVVDLMLVGVLTGLEPAQRHEGARQVVQQLENLMTAP